MLIRSSNYELPTNSSKTTFEILNKHPLLGPIIETQESIPQVQYNPFIYIYIYN